MNNSIVTLIIVISISIVQAISLNEVCSNDDRVAITTVQEVRSLIDEVKSDRSECQPAAFCQCLLDLDDILSQNLMSDVCSESSIERLRAYHSRYISKYTPEVSEQELKSTKPEAIPRSLRNFFIVYASDVAVICNRRLIERFNRDLKGLTLQLRDLDEIKRIRGEIREKYLRESDNLYKEPKHLSDLVITRRENYESSKVHLLLSTEAKLSGGLFRVYEACLSRFNGISKELFEPVVLLNNLGYGIGGLTMQETMSLLSRDYVPWILAIDTCQVIENSLNIIVTTDKVSPKVLTNADEIHKLKLMEPREIKPTFDSILAVNISHEQIKYDQLTKAPNFRSVVSRFETELNRLIRIKTGAEIRLNDAFTSYEESTSFTTEKSANIFGRLFQG